MAKGQTDAAAKTDAKPMGVDELKNAPVTLGVVILLGSLLASGLGFIYYSVHDLATQVQSFREETKVRLTGIDKDLEYIKKLTAPAAPSSR